MQWTVDKRNAIKRAVADALATNPEVDRVVVFGSFSNAENPNDLDIAVFQHSKQPYLPLALKYRRQLDDLACQIALDVIPVRNGSATGVFLGEIEKGETIYERSGSTTMA